MRTSSTACLLACATTLLAACRVPVESGPPIADPAATAARLLAASGVEEPARVDFAWWYSDRRGDVEGDGVARFNPPDSLRLDLFTSGEVAMAVALAGERLTSLGEIEDIEVPPRSFLFAMAGLFRPEPGMPPRAFEAGGDTVLVYGPEDRRLYFWADGGRLVKVEERRHGRLRRKVELTWEGEAEWPSEAEFRDLEEPSRVRWTTSETRAPGEPHRSDIFMLPHAR
ncbi:MAG: hypothetical protein ACODAA_00770 [Gemmatimonadota bacterium]